MIHYDFTYIVHYMTSKVCCEKAGGHINKDNKYPYQNNKLHSSDNSGLHVGEPRVLDGEYEVDEEDDAGGNAEATQRHTSGLVILMLVELYGDGPHRDEEYAPDQVDEQLQDGEVRAEQVGHQHCRHNDRVPDDSASAEKVVIHAAEVLRVAIPAKPAQEEDNKHQHNLQYFQQPRGCSQNYCVECDGHF